MMDNIVLSSGRRLSFSNTNAVPTFCMCYVIDFWMVFWNLLELGDGEGELDGRTVGEYHQKGVPLYVARVLGLGSIPAAFPGAER